MVTSDTHGTLRYGAKVICDDTSQAKWDDHGMCCQEERADLAAGVDPNWWKAQ